MNGVMEFLVPHEQLKLQALCLWFYIFGASRVQTRVALPSPVYFFDFESMSFATGLLLNLSTHGKLSRFSADVDGLDQKWWLTCQVAPQTIFQLKNNAKICRLLSVNTDTLLRAPHTYSFTAKTAANIQRAFPSLVKVKVATLDEDSGESILKDFVYVIAGMGKSTVSRYCI